MRTGKFCYHCGGELVCHDSSMECSSCGAVYSNFLISETEFTDSGYKVLEIGLRADITVRTPVEPLGEEIREFVPSVATSTTLTPAEAVA